MNVRVHIGEQGRWRSSGGVMVRGSAYNQDVRLDSNALCRSLSGISGLVAFVEIIKNLNGFFSIICVKDHEIYAAVDPVRSIPLFYAVHANGTIIISDDAFWIKEVIGETHRNDVAEEEFILLGYVTGSDTLCREIKQIQPGSIVSFTGCPQAPRVNTMIYARYVHQYDNNIDESALRDKFDQVLTRMTRRMTDYAGGRQILLPLSGGFDSRLLALLLKRSKYKDVATFSYGNIHSEESVISKAVAQGLEFPWLFVPYSTQSWKRWFHSPEFRAYKRLAFQLCTCVHVQDFPAIWQLKRENLISADAVVIPGICADLQAGSMSKDHRRDLYRPGSFDPEHVIESIVAHHYTLFDWAERREELYPQFRNRIASFLGDMSAYPDAASAFESQFCAEKVAKYLVNSVRAYEYWGYDWWLPYWDVEFIRFWETVPLVFRIDKAFYNGYVKKLQATIMRTAGGKNLGRDRDAWWWKLRKLSRRTLFRHVDRMVSPVMKKWFIGQNDEFKWFGIMNEKQFRKWYTGRESIQSALVLEYVGRWTIQP